MKKVSMVILMVLMVGTLAGCLRGQFARKDGGLNHTGTHYGVISNSFLLAEGPVSPEIKAAVTIELRKRLAKSLEQQVSTTGSTLTYVKPMDFKAALVSISQNKARTFRGDFDYEKIKLEGMQELFKANGIDALIYIYGTFSVIVPMDSPISTSGFLGTALDSLPLGKKSSDTGLLVLLPDGRIECTKTVVKTRLEPTNILTDEKARSEIMAELYKGYLQDTSPETH